MQTNSTAKYSLFKCETKEIIETKQTFFDKDHNTISFDCLEIFVCTRRCSLQVNTRLYKVRLGTKCSTNIPFNNNKFTHNVKKQRNHFNLKKTKNKKQCNKLNGFVSTIKKTFGSKNSLFCLFVDWALLFGNRNDLMWHQDAGSVHLKICSNHLHSLRVLCVPIALFHLIERPIHSIGSITKINIFCNHSIIKFY